MRIKTSWRWCDLPQLIDCETASKVFGRTCREIQKQCKAGNLPAKKIMNRWYIDTEILKKEFEQ